MKILTRRGMAGTRAAALAGTAALAGAAALAAAAPAGAATFPRGPYRGAGPAVFVQTDNTAGNQVVAYDRAGNGTLTQAGTYPTGGLGGQAGGSTADHLSSQGSLAYDRQDGLLLAVNAGSGTVSVLAARGDRLALRQVISSGGTFPVSIAVHGTLAYVLNAENGGSLQGYRISRGRLLPLPGPARPLGLDTTAVPQFTHTPGQVAFSPDGSQLIVTTKASGDDIDVFAVRPGGSLAAAVINPEPGTVPFGVTFDRGGQLVVTQTGSNALATYALSPGGRVTLIDAVPTGQEATCWVAPAGRFLFASNAGSATESGYSVTPGGQLTLLGQAATGPATIDASATPGGRFLYVQAGPGIVDEFAVTPAGALTAIGSVTVPGGSGAEGIIAR
jgi:DNA-binding beta-propeller fold protein YncE